MQKVDLYEMLEFGKNLETVIAIPDGAPKTPHAFTLWSARIKIDAMSGGGSPLLKSSKRAAVALSDAITRVIPKDFAKFIGMDLTGNFDWDLAGVKQAVTTLESVLRNDMPDIASYVVSQKGIFRTDDLIANAENHLSAKVRASLPEQACDDIRAAGKCLAYELPTACAFHLWRAVETVVVHYYRQLSGKTLREGGVSQNWGAYIKALQDANAEKKITEFLDHIRSEYRNPQTHPDEKVSVEEAQGLLSVALSVIDQTMRAVDKLAYESVSKE